MAAQGKIKTRCPVCRSAYRVPENSVGHRARCPKCDSVFRVMMPDSLKPGSGPAQAGRPEARHPAHRPAASDDDVMRWLMDGGEMDELPPEPRRWRKTEAPNTAKAETPENNP